MTTLNKAFDLNDALININPTYNGKAYAIGFRFNDNGHYVITFNKGDTGKIVAVIPKDLFESMSVKYLAHMYENIVTMAY